MADKMMIRSFEEGDRIKVIELWKECDLVVPWNDPDDDINAKLRCQPEHFYIGILDVRFRWI